jgi:hypothetical protein
MCGMRTLDRHPLYARGRMDAPPPLSPDIDPARLVPVVVGGHLRAEIGDRPAAGLLATRLDAALHARTGHVRACLLTDVWYLNDERFRDRPVVSVGAPDVNALTAFLADKLPSVLSQELVYVIQLDLEFASLRYADALAARSLADAER